jgi:hypothetical protein
MSPPQASSDDALESGELEFFGVKLKVRNPHLAALLNSSVNEDVQVIGRRARDAFGGADDERAEREVEERVLHADDSVSLRLDEPGEA